MSEQSMVERNVSQEKSPSDQSIRHAVSISIAQDKPIMLDYWTNSIQKECFIGVKDDGDKLLVKNEEEYTSPIAKIFKVTTELLVLTENSIYIVDAGIASRKIR